MGEPTNILDLFLSYNNLIVMIVVMAIIEALKRTLDAFKILSKKPIQILLPYLPLVLGGIAGFVPGAIQGDSIGVKILTGVACGAVSGQVWKILKTKIDLLKGKFDDKPAIPDKLD